MDQGLEGAAKGIFERAKAIILTPRDEWPKIEVEAASQTDILKGYVIPLVAIGPVATLIGGQLFGYGAFGFSYRPGIVSALGTAAFTFALGVLAVYILTFIADFLAPKFGGQSSRDNAFRMIAYGGTAAWLSGIFGLIPSLAVFGLLGLYSIYLYYTGATPLMKVPQDKAVGFTAVTILCAVVLMMITAPIAGILTGALFGSPLPTIASSDGGRLTLPGGASFDTSKVEQMGKQMEAAANGKAPPVDASRMQSLLPETIGSYQRTATETSGMAMGSQAEGTYTAGDNSFRLKITDMSAIGAIAGLGAAMGVQKSREDADGYERTGTVDGQMQSESWSKSRNSGKFSIVIANRFMIEAEGKAANIDELKSAVNSVDQGNLLSLAG